MAGSFLSKAMNWLNKIFRTMGSPISGFGIDDVKVKENAGEYSALLQFNSENTLKDTEGNETTTIKNEGIELDVLLITADANTALRPLYDGMNHIGESAENFPEKAALIDVLLGDDRKDNTFVENSGKGLLGMVFDTGTDNQMFKYKTKTYDGKSWSWGDITDDISFSLECQSPGKEYGAIASQDLSSISRGIQSSIGNRAGIKGRLNQIVNSLSGYGRKTSELSRALSSIVKEYGSAEQRASGGKLSQLVLREGSGGNSTVSDGGAMGGRGSEESDSNWLKGLKDIIDNITKGHTLISDARGTSGDGTGWQSLGLTRT